ncbi:hypothetical protein LEP1GSC108_4013 [Leptospira weilii str. UI 13098]|uniref:Uncharacterized protein n=1 Tax=Leptospira weilii str. UI 13098 TaxID=1088542 RepID=M6Q332_9LEPT|nr:hypothetical protein LEP1GSC108_4013 [Leptospira weilii str. UI 13098]
MQHRLIFKDEKSDKFWNVEVSGNPLRLLTVRPAQPERPKLKLSTARKNV